MGLEVKPSLKKYVDDLVAAEVATLEATIAAIQPAKIKTGTYTGNSVDNRNIDIGVDLASKNNVWVVIKNIEQNTNGVFRTERGQGDDSCFFGAAASVPNAIQSFTNTGFQIGSLDYVNADTRLYVYIAIWEEP